jgi:hypothetical protein
MRRYKDTLLKQWEELPTIILTSSEKKQGGKEVLSLMEELIAESGKHRA